MPSEKFRITTNGQSLRNPNNGFFGMTLSANMTLDESDVSAHNDRRSAHNALERQRREHLNIKFQQLAHALPSLQTVRRPSKTMIVAKSLEFVSSSIKRESNFMSEIQKLRMENDKLRKQAENSSSQLKKRQLEQDDDEEANNNAIEETTETNNTKSLERKASSDSQLSPPPTPEAMRCNQQQKPVQPQQKKVKRMVKQTKSLQSQPAAMIKQQQQQQQSMLHNNDIPTTPWSPLLDDTTTNNNLLYPTSLSPPNYFAITPYTTASLSNTNHLFTTPPAMDMYHQPTTNQYHNMMHPMLLSPYFVPNDTTVDGAVVSFSSTPNYHQRSHSNNSINNFYLSS